MLGGLAEIPRTMWESLGLKEKGGWVGGMKQSRRRDKNRETEEKRERE